MTTRGSVGHRYRDPSNFFTVALITFADSMIEDLFKAAKYNDLNAINVPIREGADTKATDALLATSIIVAAKAGKPQDLSAPDPL